MQGESTSAFVGALTAFYNKIPVGHIGAGVRTFKKMEPYPEEVNRRMVSTLSDLHFTANAQNSEYLLHGGAIPRNIFISGDTIIDSITSVAHRTKNTLEKYIPPDDLNAYKMILVTSHLKENWGRPLEDLCQGVIDLTQAYPDIQIAFPLKFNAGVRDTVYETLKNMERIHLLDQLPYEAFVEAMAQSYLMITDSICIMEECLALRKPVLVFRNGSDSSAVSAENGFKWIGMQRENLVVETSRLLEDVEAYQNMTTGASPMGDGHAAERIVQAIRHHFGRAERPKDYKPKTQTQAAAMNSKNIEVNQNAIQ